MKTIITVVLVGFISLLTDKVQAFAGKVITVINGNTIEVMGEDNESYKIRFIGIDCPELGQEYGDKAKKYLEKMILDKKVDFQIKGKDRWGNKLGIVLIDGVTDPRINLLEAGLAWTAEKEPNHDFETIREKAKENNKGLWKETNPTPPWIYRRQQTMMQPKSS